MSSVFLRQGEKLIAMSEQPYEAESVLQRLLAQHPELLVADDDSADRGLLLVREEAPLNDPVEQLRAGWLDHLLVDRNGVPVLVEVKRQSDTRIRREVVGQMLDYAANAAACWGDATLRTWFEARCEARELDPSAAFADVFPTVADADAFWSQVSANVTAGRLRLVFVADEIPLSLQRIVEFLNEQMHRVEVLALEVKQYVDAAREVQTIVPRLVGRTAAAQQAKDGGSSFTWNRKGILDALRERHGAAARSTAEAVFAWAAQRNLRFWFGSGRKDGSFQAGVQDGTRYVWPFTLYTYGRIEIKFLNLARRPPFDDPALREELRRRLNEIPGVALPGDAVDLRPSIDLSLLTAPEALQRFLATMDWTFAQAG